VRLDQVKPSAYIKRFEDPSLPKKAKDNHFYDLEVEVSFQVRHAVTMIVRHGKQELGHFITSSLSKI
jgi:hypothetical protein